MADDQNPQLPLTPPPGGGDSSGIPGAANIQPVNIEEEMRRSYLDYAMSVIIGRAIPDVRDGLKPVHRRILYSMFEQKIGPSGPFKKCARVVGDVLAKYHPHGDMSVYDAMVRMAQTFSMRHPGIEQAYRTGRGSIYVRARTVVEKVMGKGEREQIVLIEIPYQVNKARLTKRIAELARDKEIEGIAEVRDESDREGIRLVIELKK